MRAISCGVDLIEISRIKRALERQRFHGFHFPGTGSVTSKQPNLGRASFLLKR